NGCPFPGRVTSRASPAGGGARSTRSRRARARAGVARLPTRLQTRGQRQRRTSPNGTDGLFGTGATERRQRSCALTWVAVPLMIGDRIENVYPLCEGRR